MTKIKRLMRMVEVAVENEDVEVNVKMLAKTPVINILFKNFEGFDEEWNEIEREYTDEELIDMILDFIDKNGEVVEFGGIFTGIKMDDKIIFLTWASDDI